MVSFQNQTLLVLAPHPDDEILGCGGLIQKIKDAGGKVYVLFLTVGDTKDVSRDGFSSGSERVSEIKKVAECMRFDGWKIAFEGNDYHLRLDAVPQKDIVDVIENDPEISIQALHPTILATTRNTDYNQDHRACARAAATATRPAPRDDHFSPNIILEYDSVITNEWGSKNVTQNNFFLNLSEDDLSLKIKALQLYASQIRPGSHQRSPEGLRSIARFEGFFAGCEYAEGFTALRIFT